MFSFNIALFSRTEQISLPVSIIFSQVHHGHFVSPSQDIMACTIKYNMFYFIHEHDKFMKKYGILQKSSFDLHLNV